MRIPYTRRTHAWLITLLILLLSTVTAHAQESIPEVPTGDFRLVVKEAFIIEQIEGQFKSFIQNISAYGIPIGDPEIDLKAGNKIEISATTELPLGSRTLEVRPTVVIGLSAEDNQMMFTVESVRLEGMALPASLIAPQIEGIQAGLQEQINVALIQTARLSGLELVAIHTTEDLIMLDFDFTLEFYQTEEN